MKRIHVLEWEDLTWFPKAWRDYGTDYLKFVATRFGIYRPILPVLEEGLRAQGQAFWVDCASGGGSGLIPLVRYLSTKHPNLKLVLTDFFPNLEAFQRIQSECPHVIRFESKSIDATRLPSELQGGFRTLFGAFHHFRPLDASRILQNAVDSRAPIAVFEPVGRDLMSFISMAFVIFNVLLLTPFIRPIRWQVWPFIYLLPIIPFYILWDGIASILRTYSVPELNGLVHSLKDSDSFSWEIGTKKSGPMRVYYLLGVPIINSNSI